MLIRPKWFPRLLILGFLLVPIPWSEPEAAEPKAQSGATEQTWPYLTTANVQVRSGPGTQYSVVAEIKSGTKVNAVATDGQWLKIVSKQGNPPGYIPEVYAKPTGEPIKRRTSFFTEGSYVALADANVREGPGLRYKTVAKITKGMKIHVVDEQGDWLKIQSKHGRPPGYIEKKYAERQQTN